MSCHIRLESELFDIRVAKGVLYTEPLDLDAYGFEVVCNDNVIDFSAEESRRYALLLADLELINKLTKRTTKKVGTIHPFVVDLQENTDADLRIDTTQVFRMTVTLGGTPWRNGKLLLATPAEHTVSVELNEVGAVLVLGNPTGNYVVFEEGMALVIELVET